MTIEKHNNNFENNLYLSNVAFSATAIAGDLLTLVSCSDRPHPTKHFHGFFKQIYKLNVYASTMQRISHMRYWILTGDYKSTMKNYVEKKPKKSQKSVKKLFKKKDVLSLSELEIYSKQESKLFAELLAIKNKHCSDHDIKLLEAMDQEEFLAQINRIDRYPRYLPASDFIVKEGNQQNAEMKYMLFKVLYKLLMSYLPSSSPEKYLSKNMSLFKPLWSLFRAFRFYYKQNGGRGRPELVNKNPEEAKTKLEANKYAICEKVAHVICQQLGPNNQIHIVQERKKRGWDDIIKTNSSEVIHREMLLLLGDNFADIVFDLTKKVQRRKLMYEAKRFVTRYIKKKWRLHETWSTRKKLIGHERQGSMTIMNYKMITEKYLYQKSHLKQLEYEYNLR